MYFLALATADLLFVMTCIPRGIRVATSATYYRIYPVVKFLNEFAYTASMYLTVTLIMERYSVLANACQCFHKYGTARIKCIIAIVYILSFIYDIPIMFQFTWERIDGKIEVVKTELYEDGMYYHIKAWTSFTFRFLIPTLCLAIFSVLTILKVHPFDSFIFLRMQSLIWLPSKTILDFHMLSLIKSEWPLHLSKTIFDL